MCSVLSAVTMGNIHTVGPNEALIVSGKREYWRTLFVYVNLTSNLYIIRLLIQALYFVLLLWSSTV